MTKSTLCDTFKARQHCGSHVVRLIELFKMYHVRRLEGIHGYESDLKKASTVGEVASSGLCETMKQNFVNVSS